MNAKIVTASIAVTVAGGACSLFPANGADMHVTFARQQSNGQIAAPATVTGSPTLTVSSPISVPKNMPTQSVPVAVVANRSFFAQRGASPNSYSVNPEANPERHGVKQVRNDRHFTYQLIDPPHSVHSEARAIDSYGNIAGMFSTYGSSQIRGFIYHDGIYTEVVIPEAHDVYLLGMNDDGTIVGAVTTGNGGEGYHGLIIQHGAYTLRDDSRSNNTVLTGISTSGDIVGYTFGGDSPLKDIKLRADDPDLAVVGSGHIVCDINDAGTMAGYRLPPAKGSENLNSNVAELNSMSAHTEGTIEYQDRTETIHIQSITKAFGINDAGVVVGTYSDPHGFLYHNGQTLSFDVPGSNGKVGTQGFGINNRGIVVGMFEDYSDNASKGQIHGFVAVPR